MYAAFPACEALTVQVPTATSLTVLPETVQTASAPDEKETGRPDVAVAEMVYVPPTTAFVGLAEVIWTVCSCFGTSPA